ncbi:MAG: glutathione transferase GstA [Pseudomonadota bacterium]|nr:glutathione transferase GstA [Pseudomonadota bacterium]
MKLYYAPGACSLSPHIVLLEAGLPFTMEKVDLKTKKTERGTDYLTINSKGAVPALQFDDGRILTEGPAIVQYLADQKPDLRLAPRAGSFERYQLMEFLNYISAELHKSYGALFNPGITPEWKAATLANLQKKFEWLSGYLGNKTYAMGEAFTVADSYLFTVLSWSARLSVDLAKWHVLSEYLARVGHRPKVQEALKAEGLIH